MKKFGFVGGIGPESTIYYYRQLIRLYREQHETDQLPEFLLNSVNLLEFTKLTSIRDWDGLADALTVKFAELEQAGVDYAGLCAVTPHVIFERVSERVGLPLVSMVEETCKALSDSGASECVLWGTKLTGFDTADLKDAKSLLQELEG